MKDISLKETPLKDTSLKDTSLKDTSLKDTLLKDTSLKDTSLAVQATERTLAGLRIQKSQEPEPTNRVTIFKKPLTWRQGCRVETGLQSRDRVYENFTN